MFKKRYRSFLFCIVILLPFFSDKLQAQFVCSGTACALLPWTDAQMFQTLGDYKIQYFDLLAKDMAKASMIANISGPPVGTVNLSGFTYGLGASGGYVGMHKIYLFTTFDRSIISNIESAGGAVVPKIFFGFNIGSLWGESYKPFTGSAKPPHWLSPARFDIYLSFGSSSYENKTNVEYNFLNGNFDLTRKYSASARNEGIDIRYHLIEGKEILGGPLLRFLGLSVGGGYHKSSQGIFFFEPDRKSVIELSAGTRIIWSGGDMVRYSSRTEGRSIEAKTGIQLLYFLNLTAAIGTSQNRSTGLIQGTRAGNIYGENDLAAALGIATPDAFLMLNLQTPYVMNRAIRYSMYGIEFNFGKFKITADETFSRSGTGRNIGLRYEF
jgi:hypothetical protein